METRAEKIARLQREIGERQMELQWLVLGSPTVGVGGVAQSQFAPVQRPTIIREGWGGVD